MICPPEVIERLYDAINRRTFYDKVPDRGVIVRHSDLKALINGYEHYTGKKE